MQRAGQDEATGRGAWVPGKGGPWAAAGEAWCCLRSRVAGCEPVSTFLPLVCP